MSELYKKLFSSEQQQQTADLVSGLSRDQLLWLEGYLSGVNNSNALLLEAIGQKLPLAHGGIAPQEGGLGQSVVVESKSNGVAKLKILFGSHSGNSKIVAGWAAEAASGHGIEAEIVSMADYKPRDIKSEKNILVIVSTHGEGEPPVAAEDLHGLLFSKKAPRFSNLNFAVIGLGDSSYKYFCKTGLDFHQQFESLGGKAIHDVFTLDVDYKETAQEAIGKIIPLFRGHQGADSAVVVSATSVSSSVVSDKIFEAPILERVQLNGQGSEKETWHIELSLEGSGLTYQPGDALEVYAKNSPHLVSEILKKLDVHADEKVKVGDRSISIWEALEHHFEITVVTKQVIKKYAEFIGKSKLDKLIDNSEKLEKYLYGSDVLDLLTDYPPSRLSAAQLVHVLRKLPPRLYSISSSIEANPEEVHITVGAVRFKKNDRQREGVASTYLADRLGEDETLPIRIKSNDGFRLPENTKTQIIMVGPGTGIAPFRSFIQEREACEAKGRNWLFYGDQHFTTDFLYQAEWLKYRSKGVLSRLDVAFSRDQDEKIYVQDKIKSHSKRIFKWIENGAHFYICGDMKRMARDVKEVLLQIIQEEGSYSEDEATEYFKQMRKSGQFQEDVY